MNLLAKYYRINIVATIMVVILSSIFYYFMIHHILLEQLDNSLKVEEQEVIDFVKANNRLPAPSSYKDQEVNFSSAIPKGANRKFSTIKVYNKAQNENESYRQLLFNVTVKGKTYNVSVHKSQEETEDLIQLILITTLAVVILLLLVIFLINQFVLKRIWKPFDATLLQLEKFNLSGKSKLKFENTDIDEFKKLNKAVAVMSKQVNLEYQRLKNFTENASHEMQTPLAIINSKLDLLIQGENINEQQMEQLQAIYNALERLSKMNQSLLLLTRIENNQFKESETISLEKFINEKLAQFDELIINRQLTLNIETSPLQIKCNKQLLDVLLGNLLSNAIRYNIAGGTIAISIKENQLNISNSSFLPCLDVPQLFQRFYRHEDTLIEGNGLGLSIIKEICNNYGFKISYNFKDGLHQFQIKFPV